MNAFTAYVLLCASSVGPSECNPRSAIDVVLGPETSSEIACEIEAQEMMAGTALRPQEGEYFKISCARRAARPSDEGQGSAERPRVSVRLDH